MITLFKQLMCKHDGTLKYTRGIYGDEIIFTGGKRAVFYCTKCGARVLL